MSSKNEYITVNDFALLTGMSPKEIVGKFTIEIGDRHLVPRFMIANKELNEVAHINLPVEAKSPDGEYNTVAVLDFDLTDLRNTSLSIYELASARAAGYPGVAVNTDNNVVETQVPTTISTVNNVVKERQAPATVGGGTLSDTLAGNHDDSLKISLETEVGDGTIRRHKRKRKRKKKNQLRLSNRTNPLRRTIARFLDLLWETGLALGCILTIVLAMNPGVTTIFTTPWMLLLLSILIIPIALILDSLTYALFGNTPGKFALGLKVVSGRFRSLDFSRHLARNFRFWRRGLAYGLLPLTFYFSSREVVRIGKGIETHYDKKGNTRVGQATGRSKLDKLTGIALAIGIFPLIVVWLGQSIPTINTALINLFN